MASASFFCWLWYCLFCSTFRNGVVADFRFPIASKILPLKKTSSTSGRKLSSPTQRKRFSVSANMKKCQNFFDRLCRGDVEPWSRGVHHALYWLSALSALEAVRLNKYGTISSFHADSKEALIPGVYKRLFYFARLRPRLLFCIGSLLRALQLCTPIVRIIDPSIGVGAGINLLAMICGSRWVKPLVLGWTLTRSFWTLLGAKKVEGGHLPITLSIRELERRKPPSIDEKVDK
mmetsp:Transcript_33087/g.51235  ORF Transcript_33087/g.51235 Transcript_33087/m.51235 type:complete len:233 (-) Transcript_33087:571-1269(-)